MAPDRVNLINEHDGGRRALGRFKQVPDAGRAHAHEHLHELRTRNVKKRHAGLSGHRARQERFSRPGSSHQQNSLRNPGAYLQKLFRAFQKIHNLHKLFLGLLGSRHVAESKALFFGVGLDHPGSGLAESEGLHVGPLNLPGGQPEKKHDQQKRQ